MLAWTGEATALINKPHHVSACCILILQLNCWSKHHEEPVTVVRLFLAVRNAAILYIIDPAGQIPIVRQELAIILQADYHAHALAQQRSAGSLMRGCIFALVLHLS